MQELRVLLLNKIQNEFIDTEEEKNKLPSILDEIKKFIGVDDNYFVILNTHGESEVNPSVLEYITSMIQANKWVKCSFKTKEEIKNYLNVKLFTMKMESGEESKPKYTFNVLGFDDSENLNLN